MENTRPTAKSESSARRFREQAADQTAGRAEAEAVVVLTTNLPLEVNMTDEPGGDPYNHTGSFKRLYR